MGLLDVLEQGDLVLALVPPCRVVAALRTSRRVRNVLVPLVRQAADGDLEGSGAAAGGRPRKIGGVVLAVRYEQRVRELGDAATRDLRTWGCGFELRVQRGVHLEPLLQSIHDLLAEPVRCELSASRHWPGPSVLRLDGCHMGASGARLLGMNVLQRLRGLRDLHLTNNDIGDAGMHEVYSSLRLNAWGEERGRTGQWELRAPLPLRALHLRGNNIGKRGAHHLGSLLSLTDGTSLRTLDIADNQLGAVLQSHVSVGLRRNANLETLDLRATALQVCVQYQRGRGRGRGRGSEPESQRGSEVCAGGLEVGGGAVLLEGGGGRESVW